MEYPSRGIIKNAICAGAIVAAFGGLSTTAHAVTLSGTFGVSIYQGSGGGDINNANNQAQQANPLIAPGSLLESATFTGALDLSASGSNTTIGDFFNSSAGSSNTFSSTTLNTTISTSNFGLTSIFVFTGFTPNVLTGIITHDDGMSLYDGVGYTNTVASAPFPVVASPTAYTGLTGLWELIYAEANGLPAVLNFDVTRSDAPGPTPLPAALSLFAGGAGVLGFFARRRKRKNSTA
jgi:hypothetical protein